MSTQANNPFVFPGLGQGESNPLLASMAMMRQAWQDMTSAGMFAQPVGASALTTEQLDKRIADMRAVEGWLKLNLSMLTSSIQALEVQRATLGTLKSYMGFAAGAAEAAGATAMPSPLDVALGIKPSGQARIRSAGVGKAADKAAEQGGADPAAVEPFSEAAQAWWSLLQQQFNTLTAATAASMQATDTTKASVMKAQGKAKSTSARTSAAPKTASASRKKNGNSRTPNPVKSSKPRQS